MTQADILQYIFIFVTFVIGLSSWINKRAESRKLKAETETLYQDMAKKSAENEEKLQAKIDELNIRLDERNTVVQDLNKKVDDLKLTIVEMRQINEAKDNRIQELESLSIRQGNRIAELELEVQALRLKRK